MKTLTLIIAFVLSVNLSSAQDSKTLRDITIAIENIANNNGNIVLGLHTEDTFMKAESVASEITEIVDGKTSVTFKM